MSHPSHAVPLTWLYVPGDRPERVAKALASEADVVILDLEDAVSPDAKDAAREGVARAADAGAAVAGRAGRALQIRVNAVGTLWHAADMAMVCELPSAIGLRLPKCEDPAVVRDCSDALRQGVVGRLRDSRVLHLLLESALGVERAFALATCDPAVASICLGEADLSADLGLDGPDGLGYARGRVINVAAAAGLPAPAMSVYPNHRDLQGLAASCEAGRRLGFRGRTAIHPAQLPVIRQAFTPSQQQIDAARQVIAAAEQGRAIGSGAVALPDGRFVDAAVVRRAATVLSLASPGPALTNVPDSGTALTKETDLGLE